MPRIRQTPARSRKVVATVEKPTHLSEVDLLRLDGLRSRWERIDLVTQLATFKIDAVTRKARAEIATLSLQLERDIIDRQKAKDAYDGFRKDVETRYGIDLGVVSYDDETGLLEVPA